MILKLLVVIGVIAFIYFTFIKKTPISQQKNTKTDIDSSNGSSDMVECERCGIYVEIGEAVLSNGRYYCSNECLKG